MPVQVDGEPWVQSPGDVVVLKSALKVSILKISFCNKNFGFNSFHVCIYILYFFSCFNLKFIHYIYTLKHS